MKAPMSVGSRVCPHCGALNAADEARCHRCSKAMPGPMRTALGEWVGTGLGQEFPVTQLLIGFSTLVFMLSVLGKGPFPLWMSDGVRTSEALRFGALLVPSGWSEPWRHLSAVFVHANALHLLLNLLALLSLGRAAESAIGWSRFTVAFVGSGCLGYLVSHAWFVLWGTRGALLVGASGAIFGLLGLEVGILLARRAWEARSRLLRALALAAVIGLMIPVQLGHLGAPPVPRIRAGRERRRTRPSRRSRVSCSSPRRVRAAVAHSPQWPPLAVRIATGQDSGIVSPVVGPDGSAPRWSISPAWRS